MVPQRNRTLGCEEGHPKMRKFLLLCGTILCMAMTAAAQDASASLDATGPEAEPAAPVPFEVLDRTPWQIGIGYQYQHSKPNGIIIHTNGFNTHATRYLNDWIGVEGAAVMGWGSTATTPSFSVKTLFVGGGPHAALNSQGRIEPWVHGLIGYEFIRKSEGGSGLGFMGGGGIDFKIRPRLYWRFQGDFLGTRFNSHMQTGYSAGTGLVINF
jgi:hypothetical protein